MSKVLNKILIITLVILVLNNFLFTSIKPLNINFNTSYAADGNEEVEVTSDEEAEDAISGLLGSIIGIFTLLPKLMAVGLAFALDSLTALAAYSQGQVNESGTITAGGQKTITPFDIFFNRVALLDINFFKVDTNQQVITNIRTSIASWYYVMRILATSILLVVLIYIGIRMALSTVASEKAMYKKMLVDWVTSLALVFLLHYIAIFIIEANAALMRMIEGVANTQLTSINQGNKNAQEQVRGIVTILRSSGLSGISLSSLSSAVVYCMIVVQTFGLFVSYFTRMLKLAFLLIIAPLITLTYSIDKIGDGKAQALGNWLKEFTFTVLIQPFHAIIYASFVAMALNLVADSQTSNGNIAGGLLAILCLRFTKEAEKIVRKIFAFKDDGSAGSIAGGMAMSAMALGAAKNIGKGTKTAINQIGNAKNAMSDASLGFRAALIASKTEGSKDAEGNEMSFADRQAAARQDLEAEREAKKLEKANKKYKGGDKATSDEIKNRADEIKAASEANGEKITTSQATARARLQLAKENKEKLKLNGAEFKHKKIHGFANSVKNSKFGKGVSNTAKVISAIHKSEAVTFIRNQSIAGGIGMFLGSAAYGSGQSLPASIAAGAAGKKGAEEFLKNTTSTFKSDIKERLSSMGVNSQEEATAKMDEIITNGQQDDGRYYSKQLQQILKSIENQLKAAGLSGEEAKNVTHRIQNSVNKDLTKNPGADVGTLVSRAMTAANGNTAFAALDSSKKAEISKPIQTYASVGQENEIYKTVNTATGVGMDPNRLAGIVAGSFANVHSDIEQGEFDEKVYAERAEDISDGAIKSETTDLESENSELNGNINSLNGEIERLNGLIDEMEAGEYDHEKMSEMDVMMQLHDYKSKIDEAKQQIDEAKRQIEENSRKLEILEAEQARRRGSDVDPITPGPDSDTGSDGPIS